MNLMEVERAVSVLRCAFSNWCISDVDILVFNDGLVFETDDTWPKLNGLKIAIRPSRNESTGTVAYVEKIVDFELTGLFRSHERLNAQIIRQAVTDAGCSVFDGYKEVCK